MDPARQMLGIEEGKEEARNGLETAVQSRNVEMLEDALEEASCCWPSKQICKKKWLLLLLLVVVVVVVVVVFFSSVFKWP